MYLFDPVSGRRRRTVARDKLVRIRNNAREAAQVTAVDLKNRIWGTVAEGRATLLEGTVDDSVLTERVRSKLGFLVRHPAAIEVGTTGGRVTLSGPVLADEVQQLIAGVRAVRGVADIENRLEVHETGDGVPGLQGNIPKPTGQVLDVFQGRWSPSTRFLVGMAGIYLLFKLNPFRRRAATLSVFTGLGLLAWSVAEEEWKEINRGAQRSDQIGEASAGRSA
jgi:hypothetical protein